MAQEIQFILYNLPEGEDYVLAIIQDETFGSPQKSCVSFFTCKYQQSTSAKNIYEPKKLTSETRNRGSIKAEMIDNF